MRVQTPTFGGNFFSMILQESRSDNPTDLKFVGSNPVWVRIPPSAPTISMTYKYSSSSLKPRNGVWSVERKILAKSLGKSHFPQLSLIVISASA